jgi:MoaA/NifB/PqqE/SkfB family radical SAM enzyme
MIHQLIASSYPEGHIVVSPGQEGGIRIGPNKYAELRDSAPAASVPDWLAVAARAQWGTDLTGLVSGDAVMVRPETAYGYARASYEVNLFCNYGCEHCYLGERPFAGLDLTHRMLLLDTMKDVGVLWLQLTGGEPLIDPVFPETLSYACELGMMVQISSNGSRLENERTIELLTTYRPYRLTLSLYGASEASYDGMTQRRGSFKKFMRGLGAAREAGLNLRINIVVSRHNAHERDEMQAIANRFGVAAHEYTNISPTIHGTGEVLPAQAPEVLRKRKPYTGCNAGITHFHTDPHGKASICKVGRDPQVDLIAEGPEGLRKLAEAGDRLTTRHGGCTGCTLQKTCGTCMPLVNLYGQAQAPLETYCQHGVGPLSPNP